jgi:hypothetical protein
MASRGRKPRPLLVIAIAVLIELCCFLSAHGFALVIVRYYVERRSYPETSPAVYMQRGHFSEIQGRGRVTYMPSTTQANLHGYGSWFELYPRENAKFLGKIATIHLASAAASIFLLMLLWKYRLEHRNVTHEHKSFIASVIHAGRHRVYFVMALSGVIAGAGLVGVRVIQASLGIPLMFTGSAFSHDFSGWVVSGLFSAIIGLWVFYKFHYPTLRQQSLAQLKKCIHCGYDLPTGDTCSECGAAQTVTAS